MRPRQGFDPISTFYLIFLNSKPEQGYLGEPQKRKKKEKMPTRGPFLQGHKKLVLFRRELANLSLLVATGTARLCRLSTKPHTFLVSQAMPQLHKLSGWRGLLDPLSLELRVGTTLTPFPYRLMEQRIKSNFSSYRGHKE